MRIFPTNTFLFQPVCLIFFAIELKWAKQEFEIVNKGNYTEVFHLEATNSSLIKIKIVMLARGKKIKSCAFKHFISFIPLGKNAHQYV